MDSRIEDGYSEYLKMPLAEMREEKESEIYSNNWVLFLGLSICHPNPHRHFTLLEFAYFIGKNHEIYERFIKKVI